ncbi:redoxin family protein [Nakamurella sp. A5-74]|uniref:Redoxin family protein n=1 Tax=Nakamurella sp. A5-74 TaxID=3158264 RepID=A0AAU8DRC1_9ACTN
MFSSPRRAIAAASAAAVLVLAGCGSSGTAAVGSAPGPAAASSNAATGSGAVAAPADTAEQAAWKKLPITDVSGKTFTIGDLQGKPVFVQFFATWCPSCRAQLTSTNAAAQQAGGNAVVLALSVETELDVADVAKYSSDNNFDAVTFAVMSPEMLAAVVAAFGNNAANPPSTPHVLVSSSGAVGELSTGAEATDAITASLTSA